MAERTHVLYGIIEVAWRRCSVQYTAQPLPHRLRAVFLISSVVVSYCGVYRLAILDASSSAYRIYTYM